MFSDTTTLLKTKVDPIKKILSSCNLPVGFDYWNILTDADLDTTPPPHSILYSQSQNVVMPI